MKKIILIDDNRQNQREKYGASFVDNEEFSDCLMHIEKLNDSSDLSFLNDAACVLLHDSFSDFVEGEFKATSQNAKENILDFVQDNDIPYVLFSDGHSPTADWREEYPNIVWGIKKSAFYQNLRDFVESYQQTNQVDVRIIAYGKDVTKHLMFKWYQDIIGGIKTTCAEEPITITDINKVALKQFIEGASPKVGITFNQLMYDIDDGLVTVRNFKDNINRIIDSVQKYGKNISTWK